MLQDLNRDASSLPADMMKDKDHFHGSLVLLLDLTGQEDGPHGHRKGIKQKPALGVLVIQRAAVEETMEEVLCSGNHHLYIHTCQENIQPSCHAYVGGGKGGGAIVVKS